MVLEINARNMVREGIINKSAPHYQIMQRAQLIIKFLQYLMGSCFISSHFCEGNLSKPESVQVKAGYLSGRIKSIFKFIRQRKSRRKRTANWKAHIRSRENNFPLYVTKR